MIPTQSQYFYFDVLSQRKKPGLAQRGGGASGSDAPYWPHAEPARALIPTTRADASRMGPNERCERSGPGGRVFVSVLKSCCRLHLRSIVLCSLKRFETSKAAARLKPCLIS